MRRERIITIIVIAVLAALGGYAQVTQIPLSASGNWELPASASLGWVGGSQLSMPADGSITLTNNAKTTFGRLQFGGTSSTFPALAPEAGGALAALAADASAYTTFQAQNYSAMGAAASVSAGQISYGGTTAANTSCGTLSGSAGCVIINVAGTTHYVPYY